MDMDEVKAVVEATEEVGVAAVRAEAWDLRKTSLTEMTLARITYFPYTKLITCLTRVLTLNLRTCLILT